MIVQLLDCERIILQMVADKEAIRDSIVTPYAFAICSDEEIDFKKINMAIIERWSMNALRYIKHKAWKLVEEKQEKLKEAKDETT